MAAASKPTRTPFFSEPLLGTDIAALTQADNRAIDELLDRFGCRGGVFLDVGSNVGLQVRKLYEPELYHGNLAEPFFSQYLGPPPRCDVCSIAIEPNPKHADHLTRLTDNYRAAGVGVLFLPVAASDMDGFTEFFIDTTPRNRGRSIDLGASASPLKALHQLARYNEFSNATRVRTADLSRLILHVHSQLGRIQHTGRGPPSPPRVVMKLDTEFLELRLLPHLTWSLALCAAVDAVMVDWSNLALGQAASRQPHLTLPAVELADGLRDVLTRAYNASLRGEHCRASLLDVDDETYMKAGSKLPMHPAPGACTRRTASVGLPRMGYCDFTPSIVDARHFRLECERKAMGAVRAQTLDECVALCTNCAACRYVSFSRAQSECGWFAACDWDRLMLSDGTGFRTLPVRKLHPKPRPPSTESQDVVEAVGEPHPATVSMRHPKGRLPSTGWKDIPEAKYDEFGMLASQKKRRRVTAIMAREGALPGGDVFQFGVYTGGGLRQLASDLTQTYNITRGRFWGFDSFRGIPESNLRKHSPAFSGRDDPRGWRRGALNAADQLAGVLGQAAYDYAALSAHILRHVGYERVTLVPGYFNESLPSLERWVRAAMQPAQLVDIDCDIYEATTEAMEFMIQQRLLVPGSFVLYDDWDVDAPTGERKAHEELTRKYQIQWNAFEVPYLFRVVNLHPPSSQRPFFLRGPVPQLPDGVPLDRRAGYCEVTSEVGDCERDTKGSWGAVSSLEGCVARCRACERCSYVSYSARFDDCSWFTTCNEVRTEIAGQTPQAGASFTTVRVRDGFGSS
jgi:hypothetical protein